MRVVGLVATAIAAVMAAPAAMAQDFTWTGAGFEHGWSTQANWIGGTAPTGSVGTLTFPPLTSSTCTPSSPNSPACYYTNNDLAGLSVNALSVDDGVSYSILGNGFTLGSGGLTAGTAATAPAAAAYMQAPVTLGASQAWSIDGGAGHSGQVDLVSVSGQAAALAIHFASGARLRIDGDTELSDVTIAGKDPGASGLNASSNGIASLDNLNASDGHQITLTDAAITAGAVGPLVSNGDEILVGGGSPPGKLTVAGSLTLDSASAVQLSLMGRGRRRAIRTRTSARQVQ